MVEVWAEKCFHVPFAFDGMIMLCAPINVQLFMLFMPEPMIFLSMDCYHSHVISEDCCITCPKWTVRFLPMSCYVHMSNRQKIAVSLVKMNWRYVLSVHLIRSSGARRRQHKPSEIPPWQRKLEHHLQAQASCTRGIPENKISNPIPLHITEKDVQMD